MSAKKAIYELLTSRKAFTDSVREDGRRDFQRLVGSAVYDARRPQNSADLAVTIQRDGGLIEAGLSEHPDCAQPVCAIEIWGSTDRSADVEDVYLALEKILLGWRGTVAGLTVQVITSDTEPFENPERPFAGDDKWIYRYTTSWKVCHNVVRPAGNTHAYEVR